MTPRVAYAEAVFSQRRGRQEDDDLDGAISVVSPSLSDRRPCGQRPAGASAERGVPHRGHVARPVSALGTGCFAGVHADQVVLKRSPAS